MTREFDFFVISCGFSLQFLKFSIFLHKFQHVPRQNSVSIWLRNFLWFQKQKKRKKIVSFSKKFYLETFKMWQQTKNDFWGVLHCVYARGAVNNKNHWINLHFIHIQFEILIYNIKSLQISWITQRKLQKIFVLFWFQVQVTQTNSKILKQSQNSKQIEKKFFLLFWLCHIHIYYSNFHPT